MEKRCISARAVGFFFRSGIVNCRIGSLEIMLKLLTLLRIVNCRIGSLENDAISGAVAVQVNCRIGSLENQQCR